MTFFINICPRHKTTQIGQSRLSLCVVQNNMNNNEPYWLKPGGVPPPSNPHAPSGPVHADDVAHAFESAPTAPNPNVPATSAEIPMAQPYCPQPAYNNQPRYVNNMEGYHQPPRAYSVHPVLVVNGAPQQYGQYMTTTEEYCGPISWAIGAVLCFFTGWGCLVFCCPCDSRTVTYVNGSRVDS